MKTFELASKYSQALFDASSKINVQQHLDKFELLIKLLKKNFFKDFFFSPMVEQGEKIRILKSIFSHKNDEEFLSFITLLLEKKRLKYLPEIIKQFKDKALTDAGIIKASLFTANFVDENTKMLLVDKLKAMFQKEVQLENHIDPSMLGGGIVIINNKMLDFSVKSKLNKLKKDLLT